MKRPAPWFRNAAPASRDADVRYIKESVRLLRKFYDGFDASAGYDLHTSNIASFNKRKLNRIRSLARQLRVEMSAPHSVIRPRTKVQREAIEKHTGAPRERGRKAYVVHVPNDKTKATVRTRKGRASVVEVTKRSGAESTREYFYFADYGRGAQPKSMAAIQKRVRRMIDDLPEGWYVLVSRDYGFIGAAMLKSKLLQEIDRTWLDYDKFKPGQNDSRGLAQSLIGLSRVSTTIEGMEVEYTNRITRRARYRGLKERESRQSAKRRRMTGRR